MKIFYKIIFSSIICVIFLFIFNLPVNAGNYDLKADSISVSPSSPELNTVVTITAKVINLGSDFILSFPLKYTANFDNFTAEGSASISPALGASIRTNDYITFTLRGSFKKIGQANLSFSVDPSGFLTESETNNNSVSSTVTVKGYDLAVESLTILPAKPIINQACYILVKVKNNSSYNLYTGAGLDIIKSFPDFSITTASSTMPSLASVISTGGYLYYGYEGKFLTNGKKQFSFAIDPEDTIEESDLANNTLTPTVDVYLPSETDLTIDSIVFSQDKIVAGTPLDMTIGIKNIGKTSLSAATGFSKSEFIYNLPFFNYGINDFTADDYPTLYNALDPDDIFHYKFHGSFTKSGNFNFDFSFNDNKQIFESNYNNSTSTAVMVYNSLADAESFSIIAKSVSLVSSTTAIIKWQTDVKTIGILNYNLAHSSVNDNTINLTDSAIEHTVTLDKLYAGANYIYMITARNGTAEKIDMLNNFAMPENDALRIVSGPSVSINDKTAVFSWSTNLTSSSRIYYKKQGTDGLSEAGSETAVSDHKIELTDLAVGKYDYMLSSTSTPKTNAKIAWAVFEVNEVSSAADADTASDNSGDQATALAASLTAGDDKLYSQLKGKIILKVESKGEAYYVSPKEKKLYYLGRPADAFQVIRSQGVGITNANLVKIPIGLSALSGADADGDGLPDAFEDAIGTDKNKIDSDGDGFNDKDELNTGYSPLVNNAKLYYDNTFTAAQKGKIFLQVESLGEAWYVSPVDGKRYFLARPADAFAIMRKLGVGISNANFEKLAK